MNKRELIDAIVGLNPTAMPEFLARFSDIALREYYEHLRLATQPRLAGRPERYEQYFDGPTATPSAQSDTFAVAEIADDLDETDEELTETLAERAHRASSHLMNAGGDPSPLGADAIDFVEDFEDPRPVVKNVQHTNDPYPLELDDLSSEDPMGDIGLSPRQHRPAPPAEPVAAGASSREPSSIEALKQERRLF
jgi:hypothetical protein